MAERDGRQPPVESAADLQGQRAVWRVREPISPELLRELPGLSPMLCHIAHARGYATASQLRALFAADFAPHDPGLLPDLPAAVDRLLRAVRGQEGVAIYGDFDCDGLTASVALAEALGWYGVEPQVVIPSRDAGHGLTSEALDGLAASGVRLVITVDCGSTQVEDVQHARDLGMDVIVTDHHEVRPDGVLPNALVINPTRHDSLYPWRALCGAGVALKLIQAVTEAAPIDREWAEVLDLVALGTVADVVPVRDENRWIVIEGIKLLRVTERPGLLALFTVAGVDRSRIDPVSIGYQLAPRVNAANRLADARLAYRLLTAQSPAEAEELAEMLSGFNRRRQELVNRYTEQLSTEIGEPGVILRDVEGGTRAPGIVAVGDWAAGISGLLASKMVDRYGLPAFVGTECEDGLVAVSARGTPGVFIDEILDACDRLAPGGLFRGHGGHAGAGGFRVDAARWDEARQALEAVLRRQVGVESWGRVLDIDAEVSLRKLSLAATESIQTLAPFGHGFEEPLFLVRGATVARVRRMGADGQHVRLGLVQNGTSVNAVAFGADSDLQSVALGSRLDLACHAVVNEWQGAREPELRIRDWRPSD